MNHRLLSSLIVLLMPSMAHGQLDYEKQPINDSQTQPTDRVYQFSQQLNDGNAELKWQPGHGYLQSLLQQLQIPVSSQTLVF